MDQEDKNPPCREALKYTPKSARFQWLNPLSRETFGGMDGARLRRALQGFPGFPGSGKRSRGGSVAVKRRLWGFGAGRSGRGWPWSSLPTAPLREPRGSVDFSHLIKEENSPGSRLTFPGSSSRPANSGSVFGLSLFCGPGSAGKKKLLDETASRNLLPEEFNCPSLRSNKIPKSGPLVFQRENDPARIRVEVQLLQWGLSPLHGVWGRFGISVSAPAKRWILWDYPEQSGHGKVVDKAMEKWWPWKNCGQGHGNVVDKAMEKWWRSPRAGNVWKKQLKGCCEYENPSLRTFV